MRNLCVLCLLFSGISFGQTFSLGVLGGAPFTDVVNGGPITAHNAIQNSASSFILGPSAQLNLPLGLRVELDALYRPYGFTVQGFAPNILTSLDAGAQQWSFPLLLQYRFHFPIARPFLEVGPSFNHLSGVGSIAQEFVGPVRTNNAGIVLGGGVDMKVPLVRLSGELRYQRLTRSNYSGISNLNQAEVLFGVHF